MGRTGATIALVATAVAAIAGALIGGQGWWLHWVCKPLATMVLLYWLASTRASGEHQRYRSWVLAGLVFSLLGDVLLMLPLGLFLPGLVAFLLAHLCYIVAFVPGVERSGLVLGGMAALLLAGGNLAGLWGFLPVDMQMPVSAYVTVIGTMLALAVARARASLPGGRMAALGALCFVISDSWLAWDRFAGPFPWAIAGVLLTYWAAQWLIAASGTVGSGRQ